MTKIYCDIADINTIKKFSRKKIVKGFTTNPSLMRKAGAINYELYSKEILKICKNKPISFEVFADDYKNIFLQALKIKSWGSNVYVKIPVENSKGIFMGKVINELSKNNIKMNITAVYTHKQTMRILKKIKKKHYERFEDLEHQLMDFCFNDIYYSGKDINNFIKELYSKEILFEI